MKNILFPLMLTALMNFMFQPLQAARPDCTGMRYDPDSLVVLWTSDDPYIAERVAFMYTHTAKTAGWFDEVFLIIWGPSAKLIAENRILQEKLSRMMEDGVKVQACIACANSYGVTEKLKELGYGVKGMGKPLTGYLKSGAKVLTF